MSRPLHEARAEEAAVRAALAAAVAERARAAREAERLDGRAALDGAVPDVRAAADEQRRLAGAAAAEVERLRTRLRHLEGEVATLEASADREGRSDAAGRA